MSRPSQICIHQLSFTLPEGKPLFQNLSLTFPNQKTGLVGRNGMGKSTLMKLIKGELLPDAGSIHCEGQAAYIPQDPIISTEITVAAFLGMKEKIDAYHRICEGSIDEQDYSVLNEDWHVKERYQQQMNTFGLNHLAPDHFISRLSGGEFTRLLLTKIAFSSADFLLLDEPTNHLDSDVRHQLYTFIEQWQGGMVVISHDRTLLNLMDNIVELSTLGVTSYGGNYDAYAEQKIIEVNAAKETLKARKEILHTSKVQIQTRKERHEKNEAKGNREKKAQIKETGSYNKLEFNAAKGRSEQTNRRIRLQADRKLKAVEDQWRLAKEKIEIIEDIHVELPATSVPVRKIILKIEDLVFSYPDMPTRLIDHFSMEIQGPQRIALAGKNGCGKTTLIKLILGELVPTQGEIYIGTPFVRYLDQHARLLNTETTLLENFMRMNPQIKEVDARLALAQFLFRNTAALKRVNELSGGEKLRGLLACVLMSKDPPQLLMLDEPTNHLDLASIEQMESVLKNYRGAMIVISHDQRFLKNIGVECIITQRIP